MVQLDEVVTIMDEQGVYFSKLLTFPINIHAGLFQIVIC